jgi:hypothetical protein
MSGVQNFRIFFRERAAIFDRITGFTGEPLAKLLSELLQESSQ